MYVAMILREHWRNLNFVAKRTDVPRGKMN